jgi:hypothetical protein
MRDDNRLKSPVRFKNSRLFVQQNRFGELDCDLDLVRGSTFGFVIGRL